MRTLYLIVATLLLASLGLLEFATFPHLPVAAPIVSGYDAEGSKPAGRVDDMD
jgi:hypothetical protein